MIPADHQAREQATDPTASFIVQAPAGSGKTEILTQRFLRLLAQVDEPEQIIAITFTRKAASEMRERVLKALQRAAQAETAASPHQQNTLDYANRALARAHQCDWQLLTQPNRLRIMTIDSLCQMISQSIPLFERDLAFTEVTEDSVYFYSQAARQCLQYAGQDPEYQAELATLLLHLDNRQDKLIELLRDLLSNREQWLNLIYQAKAQEQDQFESALQRIEQHQLDHLKNQLPPTLAAEWLAVSQFIAQQDPDPESPRQSILKLSNLAEAGQTELRVLAALWLTGQMEPRKKIDHYCGISRKGCGDEIFEAIQQQSQAVMAELQHYPAFYEALAAVHDLPRPHYSPSQWQVLQALFKLLPLLVVHLQWVFQAQNQVDFTAIAQQALRALGEEDNPTDLALYLDYQIRHLLIDEFQDTSLTQFALLKQLVQGWQPGDGRSLFLVGDPMQSIYRFRQAEVGLFLQTQQQGLGPVPLRPLQLQCNFRSTANLIDWVNSHFPSIFPPQEDVESGAVSYHPAIATQAAQPLPAVRALQLADKDAEAQELLRLVRESLQQDEQQSIAILVRSRSHLQQIIAILRENKIPFQGVDINLLANLPHIQDLWTLTRALLLPANRLAWFALLRSPLIGLPLADLLTIAERIPQAALLPQLQNAELWQDFSADSQLRLRHGLAVLTSALRQRQQQSLTAWIRETWLQLQGDKLINPDQQPDLDQFWQLLDKHQQAGTLPDLPYFAEQLDKLYSQSSQPSRLQVMTIHKSKGLEFDCVIIPGFNSPPAQSDKPLLRWLKIPVSRLQSSTESQPPVNETILLMSPVKSVYDENCPIYDYIGKVDAQKAHFESQRLLYVAVTRARRQLILLANRSTNNKNSFKGLMPELAFEEIQDQTDAPTGFTRPQILRLPASCYETSFQAPAEPTYNPLPILDEAYGRWLGTLTHRLLQWIADHQPASAAAIPWGLVKRQLAQTGLDPAAQHSLAEQVKQQVLKTMNCPKGQWILAAHAEARNEMPMLVQEQEIIKTRIIDRCFVDQGIRWIIDYKTGQPEPKRMAQYQAQLNGYAEALRQIHPHEPIHCCLYFPSELFWVDWVAP